MMMTETTGWIAFSIASGWGIAQIWFISEKFFTKQGVTES